jgi:hypothetical protein
MNVASRRINEWSRWHYCRYDSTWLFSCFLRKLEERHKHERKKQSRFRRSSKIITRTLLRTDADRNHNSIQCRRLCIIFRLQARFHHCEWNITILKDKHMKCADQLCQNFFDINRRWDSIEICRAKYFEQ